MTTPSSDISGLLDQLRTQLLEMVRERDELRLLLQQAREFIIVQTWRPNESRTASTGTRGKQALGLIQRIDAAVSNQKERSE